MIESSLNFVRIYISNRFCPDLKLGQFWSMFRSLSQILANKFTHSRAHIFDPVFLLLLIACLLLLQLFCRGFVFGHCFVVWY